jgi:tRNA (guanine26-N2/guanine27-N2)-dimethyltransferase
MLSFSKKRSESVEEGVYIQSYGKKISKELEVFFNPEMKVNRDVSLLVIDAYFNKKISYCDPMIASGIREIRFLKKIPNKFDEMILGDISPKAIKNAKKNFRKNKVSLINIKFLSQSANKTIFEQFYDFIEIDPFGSPVPFLDSACQRIKHNGILSVTATDTAALCGSYPKTTKRKYGINVGDCWWYEELGLRNLIAYSIRQAAKYEKQLIPLISYSYKHYYKVFFKVIESRTNALKSVNMLSYLEINEKTQDVEITENETKFGKTYVGTLNDKDKITYSHF